MTSAQPIPQPAKVLRRNQSALRLERRQEEREETAEIGQARRACIYCGGRSVSAQHPLGANGLPVCLAGKRGFQW
jgi:hypothetical protein